MEEDRIAILLDAQSKAAAIINRYSDDMHSYRIAGEVAIKLAQFGAGTAVLEDIIRKTRNAETTILDPALSDVRRRMESELRLVKSKNPK